MKKKLPTGIQSFSDIRNKNYLYVDKTEIIYKMVTEGKVYFLSRPRRFGKSVLVSTLDALFSGRKELFEGLFIYDKWNWTQQYPVIRLDFSGLTVKTPVELEESLAAFVKSTAIQYDISVLDAPYKFQFGELIKILHQSTGRQVVVLVDEYDKPIIDHLSNKETLEANKEILHDFYQVLKASDEYIKFIFLTGVSKFSGLSVFSALNNIVDITLNRKYAALCGYTQEELEYYFTDYLDEIAEYECISRNELLDKIKFWYNGYSW
ncbi:MAG: AAA family ATPase, partial [Prevotellaceae bacterium]|nr:AAA family ATPase [Prevotellaceae bacterium]